MATGWIYLKYLQSKGVFLNGKSEILDIGAQHIFDIPVDAGRDFLRDNGCELSDAELDAKLNDYAVRSKWPSWALYIEEFLAQSSIKYTAYDIFQGPKTKIFDLNFDSLPAEHVEAFDVVMNFGTTEHVFNQYNAFRVIHEATRSGGYIFHQVPTVGYVNHGYWVYSPRTFVELAAANQYKIHSIWATGPQGADPYSAKAGDLVWNSALPENNFEPWASMPMPHGLINVLMQKTNRSAFRLPLEVSTTAEATDDALASRYV